jgi:hypothetical protein
MIDTDKHEPTQMDWILHNTREHSPDGWRKLSKSLIELSDDDRLLIEYAPKLLAEVKRLREWKAEVERICRTMNGPNRDTALFIMTNEVEEE